MDTFYLFIEDDFIHKFNKKFNDKITKKKEKKTVFVSYVANFS